MAVIPTQGYVTLPVGSYNEFKTAVNGRAFDVDYQFSCQCYDLALLLWYNFGFPQGYPVSSSLGANGIWSRRLENVGFGGTLIFDLVNNKTDIRKGDVICYRESSGAEYGHIGLADENYNGTDNINILSQNNGGEPVEGGGGTTAVNVANYSLEYFQGAFRVRSWQAVTRQVIKKKKFPFVLYASKLRSM